MAILPDGNETERGNRFMTPCEAKYERRRDEKKNQVPGSWIANRSRRPKKGGTWVRCWQENQRPQAASPRRYHGFGARGDGSCGQYPRSRRSQVTLYESERVLSSDEIDLGEMRYSAGLGLLWLTPVGAMRFSYAIPVNNKEDDETQNFQFSLGSPF